VPELPDPKKNKQDTFKTVSQPHKNPEKIFTALCFLCSETISLGNKMNNVGEIIDLQKLR